MSLQRVRINNISAGGNKSSEENSSAEYFGTCVRISSTGRTVARSSGQDDTDAENPHTPGIEKPFACLLSKVHCAIVGGHPPNHCGAGGKIGIRRKLLHS